MDEFGHAQEEDATFEQGVHGTHSLRQVHGQTDAFFCTACGAYNAGGPLRLLSKRCTRTVARHRVHAHRLLTLGVLPGPGVRIPSHARW